MVGEIRMRQQCFRWQRKGVEENGRKAVRLSIYTACDSEWKYEVKKMDAVIDFSALPLVIAHQHVGT